MRVFVWVRFSVRINAWAEKIDLQEEERADWFRYRADIFNRGLAQCLLRQSLAPQKVFLLLDDGDRALFENLIGDHGGLVEPLYVKAEAVPSALAERIGPSADDTLVFRIDSDDLVADDYLACMAATVRKAAPSKLTYCVAANGFVTDLRSIQPVRVENPPFLAAFIPAGTRPAGFAHNHSRVAERAPVLLDETARWVQLIHDSNVTNRMFNRSCKPASPENWPEGILYPPADLFRLQGWRKRKWGLRRLYLLKRSLSNAAISRFRRG